MNLVNVYDWPGGRYEALAGLYQLLSEREPHQSISHHEMPSFAKHTKFYDSLPYAAWYFVCDEEIGGIAGAVYLTRQDEIGVVIAKAEQKRGLGRAAVLAIMELCPRPRYLANVAPRNDPSMLMFQGLGFAEIQRTLEMRS